MRQKNRLAGSGIANELADAAREPLLRFLSIDWFRLLPARGQIRFDFLVWGLNAAQAQFCRQIVHQLLGHGLLAREPASYRVGPGLPKPLRIEHPKPPAASEVALSELSDLMLQEFMEHRRSAIRPGITGHSPLLLYR
jgi:hypothetical protein